MLHRVMGALAVLAVAAACWLSARTGAGDIATPQAYRASEVPLLATDSRQVRLADGPRVVVFGYVGCADWCPVTLGALSRMATARPGRFPHITFVDCDPWNDSPAIVRRYVRHFPGVEGATGDAPSLVANEVALGMRPVTRPDDVAAHDSRIFVVDREGVLVGTIAPSLPSGDLASRVEAILASSTPTN